MGKPTDLGHGGIAKQIGGDLGAGIGRTHHCHVAAVEWAGARIGSGVPLLSGERAWVVRDKRRAPRPRRGHDGAGKDLRNLALALYLELK